MACPTCFVIYPRTLAQGGTAHSEPTPPTQVTNQEQTPQTYVPANRMEAIPQWRFSDVCQVDQTQPEQQAMRHKLLWQGIGRGLVDALETVSPIFMCMDF